MEDMESTNDAYKVNAFLEKDSKSPKYDNIAPGEMGLFRRTARKPHNTSGACEGTKYDVCRFAMGFFNLGIHRIDKNSLISGI